MSRKTRARAPLSRERVFSTAVTVADEEGVASLTMRKLAQKLGVEAMSLYHHVANKDAILDGMVDLVFGELELPSRDSDWKTAMRRRALSMRDVLGQHRWAIGLMDSRSTPGSATLRHHDAVIGVLRAAGFSIAMAAHAFSLIDSYVYGFVMQEQSLPFDDAEQLEMVASAMLEHLPMETYPHLAEMITQHALAPGYSYEKEFTFGLELILDGLEARQDS